jgi:hypothetical protein
VCFSYPEFVAPLAVNISMYLQHDIRQMDHVERDFLK